MMTDERVDLTNAEWSVMQCLWDNAPCTVMQVVADMKKQVGWAKSTSITMLKRMEQKGIVRSETIGRAKQYYPLIAREDAEKSQTQSFLSRVYNGSVGMMMSSMVQRQELSKQEIDQLYEILRRAEEK